MKDVLISIGNFILGLILFVVMTVVSILGCMAMLDMELSIELILITAAICLLISIAIVWENNRPL